MAFLPVFLNLASGPVVLVGSGGAAVAKLRALRAAGADVVWFTNSLELADSIAHADCYAGHISVKLGEPDDADFAHALALVCACGRGRDDRLAARARAFNLPLNVVDRPDLSTFIFPAVVNRGEVVVAIGTGGASPVLARRLRERIESLLPARIGDLASLMGRHRGAFARVRHRSTSLRRFWEKVVDGPIGAAALRGRMHEAEEGLLRALAESSLPERNVGTVSLVGVGPGDPDLLTLRALHMMQNADVIFYDELVSPEILDRIRRDAECVPVGKRCGRPGIGQDEISRRIVEEALKGRHVVRLKGGDPFIFGRGGEELEYLHKAGIQATVIPGVTAALGCAAEAGLPLTYRNKATRLTFVTAHRAGDAAAIDWTGLADPFTTVVIYMGLLSTVAIRDGLIGGGRDPSTPAAVLARGTRPNSKSVVGALRDIEALAHKVGDGPALLVVGETVAHSDLWRAALVGQAAEPSPEIVA